jgi:hypothetical protein
MVWALAEENFTVGRLDLKVDHHVRAIGELGGGYHDNFKGGCDG